MQSVIGGYPSLELARRAARDLEYHQLSIQDVIIADKEQEAWRKFHADGIDARYLLVMRGEDEEVRKARLLLSAPTH